MPTDDDYRLLGARDGLASAMVVVRGRLGQYRSRLSSVPAAHVRVRADLQATIDLLVSIDADLDLRRRECAEAWRERQSIEIVSPYRPEPLVKL